MRRGLEIDSLECPAACGRGRLVVVHDHGRAFAVHHPRSDAFAERFAYEQPSAYLTSIASAGDIVALAGSPSGLLRLRVDGPDR